MQALAGLVSNVRIGLSAQGGAFGTRSLSTAPRCTRLRHVREKPSPRRLYNGRHDERRPRGATLRRFHPRRGARQPRHERGTRGVIAADEPPTRSAQGPCGARLHMERSSQRALHTHNWHPPINPHRSHPTTHTHAMELATLASSTSPSSAGATMLVMPHIGFGAGTISNTT